MLQMILGLALPFALSILRLVTKNPKVSAEEAMVIAEFATYATQADMQVNGTVWSSTQGPKLTAGVGSGG